jgi:hypothetical protein
MIGLAAGAAGVYALSSDDENEVETYGEGDLGQFDEQEDLAPVADANVPEWLTYDPEDELLAQAEPAEEEFDIAPVEAAPDWLNAMVPGLDMDFSAEEDEVIETEFVEETDGSRNRQTAAAESEGNPTRAFKWLVDIVDEESDSLVAPAEKRSRFVFTRPPLWLRRRLSDDAFAVDDLAGDEEAVPDEPVWLDDALDDFDDFDDFDEDDK